VAQRLGLRITQERPNVLQIDEAYAPPGLHYILNLDDRTWLGEEGDSLATEVRRARKAGVPITMIHQNDKNNHGCEFGHFFAVTPEDLIQDGLYRALALPLHPEPFLQVSSCLIARALGAVDVSNAASSAAKALKQPLNELSASAYKLTRSMTLGPGSIEVPTAKTVMAKSVSLEHNKDLKEAIPVP
jgi:hypothetical protein